MNAVIGALRAVLGLDSVAFTKGLTQAQRDWQAFGKRMQAIGKGMSSIGNTLTVGVTLPILAMGAASLQSAQEAADASGQVQAALTSMGDASGRTLDQLTAQADKLMKTSLFDDDDILRSVTANMLTFGNISGANFDRAEQAAVNLATRLKMDLQPATLLVGKALNDPVKGMAAMGRAGIQFTASQKAQIKAMVAAGNAAGAQAIILRELERQFGGAAQAAQNTDPYNKLVDSFDSLKESIGSRVLPVITPFIDGLTGLIDKFGELSPQTQTFIVGAAAVAAAIGPILSVLGPIVTGIGELIPLLGSSAFLEFAAVLTGPIGLAVAAVAALAYIFRHELIDALQAAWKTISETLGPRLKPLFDAVMNLAKSFGELLGRIFAPGSPASAYLAAWGEVIKRVFNAAVAIIGGAIDVITNIFNALAALLRGDWSAMWGSLWEAVKSLGTGLLNVFKALFPGVVEWVSKTYSAVKEWLVDKFRSIVDAAGREIGRVGEFFRKLWDAVVGHSYVPDMILGIQHWFAKLDAGMVKPADKATAAVKQRFEELRSAVATILDGMMTDQQRALRQLQTDIRTMQQAIKEDPKNARVYQAALDRLTSGLPAAELAAEVGPLTLPTLSDVGDLTDGGLSDSVFGADYRQQLADAHRDAIMQSADAIRSVLQAGWSDLMHGDLKGALSKWFEAWAAKGMENALNSVSQLLAQIFSSIGSSSGAPSAGSSSTNWIATALQFLPKIFGFARGGSFEIGGAGGIDSKLAVMRVTPGEQGAIWKKGQGPAGGGAMAVEVVPSPYFDVRVREVSGPIAARAGAQAVQASSSLIPREQRRRNSQRLGVAR